MGELAEDFALMKKIKAEERAKREPNRINYVSNKLMQIGCTIEYNDWGKCVFFEKGTIKGKIYPYKGWWSAKGIGSDRGIKKLIKKLRELS